MFLLGLWLGMSCAMSFVASANFRVVEPGNLRDQERVFGALTEGEPRRQALRYVASEINRHLFTRYGYLNLAFGLCCALAAWRTRRRGRALVAALVVALPLVLLLLVPRIVEAGRAIDFVARDPRPQQVDDFYRLHGLFMLLELVKLVFLASVAWWALRPSREPADEPAGA